MERSAARRWERGPTAPAPRLGPDPSSAAPAARGARWPRRRPCWSSGSGSSSSRSSSSSSSSSRSCCCCGSSSRSSSSRSSSSSSR
eukprot:6711292-Pyramimonas_sp.AAC.1